MSVLKTLMVVTESLDAVRELDSRGISDHRYLIWLAEFMQAYQAAFSNTAKLLAAELIEQISDAA